MGMIFPTEAIQELKRPGYLDDYGMTGVLQLAQIAQVTGCLRAISPDGKARIWLRRGKVIHAQTAATLPVLKQLLVGNAFMTESIFNRCQKQFRRYVKEDDTRDLNDTALFIQFLREQQLLTRQHSDELQRLLTEWQMLFLFAWRAGRWSFREGTLPKNYDELPALFPSRLRLFFEEMLNNDEGYSEVYPWQRGVDIKGGDLAATPVPVLINAIKREKLSGFLQLKFGFKKIQIPFREGRFGFVDERWLAVLGRIKGEFSFQAVSPQQVMQHRSLPRPNEMQDLFAHFYSDSKLQEALLRSRKVVTSERSQIRETTNLGAWIGVRLEDFFDALRPMLRWFVPLMVPLLASLFFVDYRGKVLLSESGSFGESTKTIYEAANDVIQKICVREILPNADEELRFSSGPFQIKVVKLSAALTNKALKDRTVYKLMVQDAAAAQNNLQLELIDMNPTSPKGHLVVR